MFFISELKGFQLWLAENRDTVTNDDEDMIDDSDVNAKGLEMWKKLDKQVKENYKTPRVPRIKRKKRDTDDSTPSKASKLEV